MFLKKIQKKHSRPLTPHSLEQENAIRIFVFASPDSNYVGLRAVLTHNRLYYVGLRVVWTRNRLRYVGLRVVWTRNRLIRMREIYGGQMKFRHHR